MTNTLFECNAHFGVHIDPPCRCRFTIMLQKAFSKNFEWKLQQKLWMRSFSIIVNIASKLKVKQANKGILTYIKGSIQLTHRHNSWNWVLGVAHKPLNELNVLSFMMQKMFWALERAHIKKIVIKGKLCAFTMLALYLFFFYSLDNWFNNSLSHTHSLLYGCCAFCETIYFSLTPVFDVNYSYYPYTHSHIHTHTLADTVKEQNKITYANIKGKTFHANCNNLTVKFANAHATTIM